jgi:ketosteroid isomerase-like protein
VFDHQPGAGETTLGLVGVDDHARGRQRIGRQVVAGDDDFVTAPVRPEHAAGPVYDPSGKLISRFSWIWRQEAPGQWRTVFDRGSLECNCKKQP